MYSLSVTQSYDMLTDLDVKCQEVKKERKESRQIGPEGKHVYRFSFSERNEIVPGQFGPKPFRFGTLWSKTRFCKDWLNYPD